jgi:hypothetical protein
LRVAKLVEFAVREPGVESETSRRGDHVDRRDHVADALHVERPRGILAGKGLSLAATGATALDYPPPLVGALLREWSDLAVILNALRVLQARVESAGI